MLYKFTDKIDAHDDFWASGRQWIDLDVEDKIYVYFIRLCEQKEKVYHVYKFTDKIDAHDDFWASGWGCWERKLGFWLDA